MLVVERSSTGCEIFCCLMVSECLVVKLLLGIGGAPSVVGLADRLVVKARESVVAMASCVWRFEFWLKEKLSLGYRGTTACSAGRRWQRTRLIWAARGGVGRRSIYYPESRSRRHKGRSARLVQHSAKFDWTAAGSVRRSSAGGRVCCT